MNKSVTPVEDKAAPIKANSPAHIKRLSSAELFSGARELVIEHAGDRYYLRQTNQGKLILTK
jgi:hemin uptake protein HemP